MQNNKVNTLQMRIRLHLSNGECSDHVLVSENELQYSAWLVGIGSMMKSNKTGMIVMDNPYGFYRIENIIGIDFLDPPPPDKREPLGFKP